MLISFSIIKYLSNTFIEQLYKHVLHGYTSYTAIFHSPPDNRNYNVNCNTLLFIRLLSQIFDNVDLST